MNTNRCSGGVSLWCVLKKLTAGRPKTQLVRMVVGGVGATVLVATLGFSSKVVLHAQAQSKSVLKIQVFDPDKAAVSSAQVMLKGRGVDARVQTNGRGEAIFSDLALGEYQLSVEADGFERAEFKSVEVRLGENRFEVQLKVAPVKAEVEVAQDKQEGASDPKGGAFTRTLTPDQIARLPDDPEEFEQALRQMAGPGLGMNNPIIRVNGFAGGHLPPRNQIQEIRFRLNPYSADNHDAGSVGIDIITKPGADAWHGSISSGFRDEAFFARNAFARTRGPELYRRWEATFDGPLWRNHTSMFFTAGGNPAFDSKTIVAALPHQSINELVRRPTRTLNFSTRVEHLLTRTHMLRGEYQRNSIVRENLGGRDFDLPERAFLVNQVEHIARISDTGSVSKKLVSEFRLQARWNQTEQIPAFNTPAVIVLNAFSSGGAQVQSSRRVRDLDLGEDLDFVSGPHSMRAGVALQAASYQSSAIQNRNGAFTFSSLDAFTAERPTTFSQRIGEPYVSFDQFQFGAYFQDDFRQWFLNTRLSWSFGFGTRKETGGVARAVIRRVGGDASESTGALPLGGDMSKRWRTQFHIQAFNVTNHVNKINFSGVQTSPFFGQSTAAQPGRRLEAGMSFSF